MGISIHCHRPPLEMAIPCILATLTIACATTQADRAQPDVDADGRTAAAAAAMTMPECEDDYDVVGAVVGGVETESIDGSVFTDEAPFECYLRAAGQEVSFTFNASTTDPETLCTYDLSYEHKSTGTSFSGTLTLSCEEDDCEEIHFGVVATPVASDTDCDGLSAIEVDPVVRLSNVPPGGLVQDPG